MRRGLSLVACFLILVHAQAALAQQSRNALIDRHALAAPLYVEQSLDQLAAYLVRPARSDYDKVRALFRWIADRVSYDVASFLQGQYGDVRAEAVLQRRCAVCSGYTSLFEALARRAGIEAATVSGYAKGYGYQAGLPANHAWNAVKLGGRWHLLDVTWAAGHIDGSRFIKQFKEHYFLTPPEQMILTHCPEDPRWQLLQRPFTVQQFNALPAVEADLFEMGASTSAVWQTIQRRGFQGFVKTFAHDGPVKLVAAPLASYLQAGRDYTFVVDAPLAAKMALVHNGQFIPMQRRGRYFEGTVRPLAAEVKLAQQRNPADPQYQVILHYGVGNY